MITVLRHPTYRSLFAAQAIALLGTGLLTVALGLLAFDLAGVRAGSVLGTALTIKMVAYVGVAPLVAAAVDRLPRKAVLIGADLIRLTMACTLPWVSEAWQIYALVFVLQSASATFTPTFQALIPDLLPDREDYTRALALSRLAYDLEALISPLLAAAALTVISFHGLFIGTAAGFAASALLVFSCTFPVRPPSTGDLPFGRRVVGGTVAFLQRPGLRFVLAANLIVATGTAMVLVNSVVLVRATMGLDEAALAITLGCYGAGSMLTALMIPRLVCRYGVTRTMIGGALLITAGLAATTVFASLRPDASDLPWLLGIWFVLGIGSSLIGTPTARLLAENSSPDNRSLIYTAQFALSHACFLLTYPLAGRLGSDSLAVASAAMATVAACGMVALAVVRRHLTNRFADTPSQML